MNAKISSLLGLPVQEIVYFNTIHANIMAILSNFCRFLNTNLEYPIWKMKCFRTYVYRTFSNFSNR